MIDYSNSDLISGKIGNDGKCEGLPDVSFLVGGTIINAGYIPNHGEGGFAIDYNDNENKEMRIVFCYNDLGFWVQWHGEIGKIDAGLKLYKKISSKFGKILCEERPALVENPLKRCYSITDGKTPSVVSFNLSIKEIMLMGSDVAHCFQTKDKNIDDIILAISLWKSQYE